MNFQKLNERAKKINEADTTISADVFKYGNDWTLDMVINGKYGTKTNHKLRFPTDKEAVEKVIKTKNSLASKKNTVEYGSITYERKSVDMKELAKRFNLKESLNENKEILPQDIKKTVDLIFKRFPTDMKKLSGGKHIVMLDQAVDNLRIDSIKPDHLDRVTLEDLNGKQLYDLAVAIKLIK